MRGDRIRQLRENVNWTQEKLAEEIGVPVLQINRYENNKNKPKADVISRLSSVLGCSADYLLGLTDDPMPHSMDANNLSARERLALSAWRSGDVRRAIKAIVDDE